MQHRAVVEAVAPGALEAVEAVDIVEQLPHYPVSHSMKEPSCCPWPVPRAAR